ncbi:MAG: 30S ribosomal protein S18 [Candidatus Marinimicrobia bacterium]|jgi:small subunit ribosomal protein S18|nr:30S ribosomal protein S18 [Candidatus Neomarinimicrobiota bacterium]MCK9483063.1 30S ribosomal protein S18 [Candidatus Neomarinimicrobiota bacterium]MCK9559586.1 30S ribosomal protein S18 [Candidatus Neomarinimicrobiota bacterium]MDD5061056.1 30S ribosomal protein S18 [Candidatus Neomarinimicrobiota bacterium]MDD5230039.1 30S ribosomal protein S18 [Candidatus Neomarinimicrobiota bacterium]
MVLLSKRKICKFCENPEEKVDYKNYKVLRRFVTEQGKIIPSRITGTCARHQRELTKAIKRARNIALLPYSYDVTQSYK